MADPLTYLRQRHDDTWLIGQRESQIVDVTERRLRELAQAAYSGTLPVILLTESDPIKFLGSFMAACTAHCPVFLGNPQWVDAEWQQVLDYVKPDLIWGIQPGHSIRENALRIGNAMGRGNEIGSKDTIRIDDGIDVGSTIRDRGAIAVGNEITVGNKIDTGDVINVGHATGDRDAMNRVSMEGAGTIMIPTGGTSGQIRFAIHTWDTLMASVHGFQHYFQVEQVNACCVLPLYHVSGLMQALRSLTTGGQLALFPFKSLTHGTLPEFDPQTFFISLVPTQLKRLLDQPDLTNWLSRFQTVLLGGAPAWEGLLTQARQAQIRLAPTYGMTETASQIATLKPDDFLQGKTGCGQVLPHAHITIGDRPHHALPPKQMGNVWIQADSLALGYYPPSTHYPLDPSYETVENQSDRTPDNRPGNLANRIFPTDDLGYFDEQGYLHLVGRNSQKIISGGENIFPAEVEAAIHTTGKVADVCVIGLPDSEWGERVTAIYVPRDASVTVADLQTGISHKLCSFKRPKHWIASDRLPRNSQGKINIEALKRMIKA